MAVYLLSSGSYSLEFFPRPLGREHMVAFLFKTSNVALIRGNRMTRKGWDTGS
jgi:hypothetical protein